MEQKISKTPILQHFTDLNMPVPSHFNQSIMLRAKRHLNMFTFNATLRIMCQYHDMLRAVWDGSQLILPNQTNPSPFFLEEHNLKDINLEELRDNTEANADILASIADKANKLQSTIDITNGPLMHVAVFHLKDTDAVLFAIHHLIVDGVSWRIIVEDLNKIYTTLLQGKLSVSMPKRKCSFMQYADAVNLYSQSDDLLKELPYWTEIVEKIQGSRFMDYEVAENSATNEYGQEVFHLDEESTRFLTGNAGTKYNADINSLLLTALSRAWKKVTDYDVLSISQEGHGRERFGKQPLELERLVGWFTTIFPVALYYTDGDFRIHVSAVDDMLKNIPNKGFGYGVLRHITHHEELSCSPLMTFNYLGSFDEAQSDSFFSIDNKLPQGESVNRRNKSDTPMSINCGVADGCLAGALTYDRGIIDEMTARKICDAFVANLKSMNK